MRRHRLSIGLAWLLAVPALPAAADVDLGPFLLSGWVEAGGRATTGDDGDGDSAKFDEYRDPHEGLFGAGNLLLQHEDGKHYLRFGGYDIGEEDGEYFLEGGRWGHWGISGDLSLIPHNYSNRALTPYVGGSSGRLTLPFARPTADLDADVAGSAGDARLDFDTFEGNIGAFYKPTSDLELETGYRIIDRDGRRPEQLFYGFSNFVHFAQPVDERPAAF